MTQLTTAQLLTLMRPTDQTVPPPGFVSVPTDKLTLPRDQYESRIDYHAFYNPQTNELIITGTPKPQYSGAHWQSTDEMRDVGIFFDANRPMTGPNAGAFVEKSVPQQHTK